jgi:hypothetical protein
MVNPYPRKMEAHGAYTDADFAPFLILENVNTSGQGFGPYHADNPYHELLTGLGFVYSHTTPVGRVDGTKYAHLTYRHPSLPNFAVGIDCRPGFLTRSGNVWNARKYVCFGHQLGKYLRRKVRELTK